MCDGIYQAFVVCVCVCDGICQAIVEKEVMIKQRRVRCSGCRGDKQRDAKCRQLEKPLTYAEWSQEVPALLFEGSRVHMFHRL